MTAASPTGSCGAGLSSIDMSGETNLQKLLRDMTPLLDALPYGFVTTTAGQASKVLNPFAIIHEHEGTTVVAKTAAIESAGIPVSESWALISLQIHSSLSAVGLTAAFAKALGDVGISANVIAGFFHDHILVQWDKRSEAMLALQNLSKNC
jgi:uncharacterized protein